MVLPDHPRQTFEQRLDRILFIGINSRFSEVHLRMLGSAHNVVAVVETVGQIGRVKRLQRLVTPSLLVTAAARLGASYLEVRHRDAEGLLAVLRSVQPDLVVIAGMGFLLHPEAIAVPRVATINVHPALLPAYRGAEPLFWQLFDRVKTSGVTVHVVDSWEDHGPILRQGTFLVPSDITLARFQCNILEIGPPLLVQAVADLLSGSAQPAVQPEASPTRRARRLRPGDHALIDWSTWSIERTWQVLRGVGPILGLPPSRWSDLGKVPVIGSMVRQPAGVAAGAVGRDADGAYLGHRDGKIRFGYHLSPEAWLLAMRRGSAAVQGLIASEKAAWPQLGNS